MPRLIFEAIVPPEAEVRGVKEWIAMLLEEHGCRDIHCIEVRETTEQMKIN